MVRTRIAPSPTGFPHIGTVYQVLFDYAVAHKAGGQFVLRLEDTDRQRLVQGAEEVVYSSLNWFGLNPDESPVVGGPYGPYRQSERLEIYRPYVEELLQKGHAYYCFCTKERLEEMRKKQEAEKKPPMYDKHCRHLSQEEVQENLKNGVQHVVRMKVPEGEIISFDDVLAGHVEFKSDLIDDQVLLKSDGYPTYHMAVVVDDHLMKITHILRGKEWISSTPKHVLLYRYFGWEMPIHAHLPLILNADGKGKLSKRHGHSSVDYYKNLGYLPEAILNYMSLIVWNHPEGKEIYPFEEFVRLFDLTAITSQGPRFDLAKLNWVNGQWVRSLSDDNLISRLKPYTHFDEKFIRPVLPLVKDRLNILSEFDDLALFFFVEMEDVLRSDVSGYNASHNSSLDMYEYWKMLLKPKNRTVEDAKLGLEKVVTTVQSINDWKSTTIEDAMRKLLDESGWKIGELFMLIRVAVTGRTATPPLFETMEVLGKEMCIQRIRSAAETLSH